MSNNNIDNIYRRMQYNGSYKKHGALDQSSRTKALLCMFLAV